ncbi:hypothetical protein RHGRI_016305 [Rhododendron griersonianum]|uniref:non-specific serine/threonine protein kinase n=1 Tax=Rhododendron griersonianum TaxID=479676 RepID=A0AAV6JTP0_9ERIC|nr:hypothetical protein RHGRI_016305 [Rhododendron griersonianum]
MQSLSEMEWIFRDESMKLLHLWEGFVREVSSFRKFTYDELKKATGKFREEIGRGGGGVVYKGILSDRRVAAVKRLNEANQGAELLAELSTIGRVNHMNLIEIWGYCIQGNHRLLVYEYMERGSLAENLISSNLDWEKRFDITVGSAKGLAYLHEECLGWWKEFELFQSEGDERLHGARVDFQSPDHIQSRCLRSGGAGGHGKKPNDSGWLGVWKYRQLQEISLFPALNSQHLQKTLGMIKKYSLLAGESNSEVGDCQRFRVGSEKLADKAEETEPEGLIALWILLDSIPCLGQFVPPASESANDFSCLSRCSIPYPLVVAVVVPFGSCYSSARPTMAITDLLSFGREITVTAQAGAF